MKSISRACLIFLAAVLQLVAAQGRWDGNRDGDRGRGGRVGPGPGPGAAGDGQGRLGAAGGRRGAVTAGIIVGTIAGVIILAALLLTYRSRVMRIFGRRPPPQNSQPDANVNQVSKDLDLEKRAMKGYSAKEDFSTSSLPAVQYNQRDLGPVPPPYTGASSAPQYSPTQPFPIPHPPPVAHPPAYSR